MTTPDTADLSGSSIEELTNITSALGYPVPRILADILDIEVTQTFLPCELVAEVMLENLIGTHPNIVRDTQGEIVIELLPLAITLNSYPFIIPKRVKIPSSFWVKNQNP